LFITPLLPADNSLIVIQDGALRVDVTSFFILETRSESLSASALDTTTGKFVATTIDIQRLRLRDRGGFPNLTLHFDIRGFATTKSKSVLDSQGVVIGQANAVTAQLTGDGDKNGDTILLRASLKITGAALEILP
jgi:hypothetical protein